MIVSKFVHVQTWTSFPVKRVDGPERRHEEDGERRQVEDEHPGERRQEQRNCRAARAAARVLRRGDGGPTEVDPPLDTPRDVNRLMSVQACCHFV